MHSSFLRLPFCFAVTLALSTLVAARAQHAGAVVDFNAGTGGTPGYDNPAAALGQPSRVTEGMFGGPVDPFSPPYLDTQVVSIGAGGSLTVRFDTPILNHPGNPFGLDFLIFGNSGFVVTNAFDENFNPIGTPATDGTLFGSEAVAQVSVSADGLTFFTLSPELSPAIDALFPTDGSGDFTRPVDPALTAADFAGLTLEGIRAQYGGSAGGAGFDLGWARDASGAPVTLDAIRFVRVEVTGGKAEIDGFSAVAAVPEPSTWTLMALGGSVLLWNLRRRAGRCSSPRERA